MVRFEKNALIIEIPCEDNDPAVYYTGLQNALWGVYWQAMARNNRSDEIREELNWIAAYLGPALAHLEPAAIDALNQVGQTEGEQRPLNPCHYTNEEILAFLQELPMGRFEWLHNQFANVNKE